MELNNLIKTNKKIRLGKEQVLVKEKLLLEVIKGKNRDQVQLLKVLREAKCLYIEDFLKRGFKSIKNDIIAILNLSRIQSIIEKPKNDIKEIIDLNILKEKKLVNRKYRKLKILGSGQIKKKIEISAHFASKQALSKIEKVGGKLTIVKK